MSIEIVQSILLFAGGIGMFVYGMQVMADGLQQAAGEKTRRMLEILTSNRIMGVLLGALVTAIIQSSGATTVMVVGFVNAGLMSLSQAVGVIMGANIGTTMTAWIVSMSEWGAFLKPEMIAPLLLIIGVGIQMASKRDRVKQAADILIGFGILFIGLSTMSNAVTPYSDEPIFTEVFHIIGGNPLLGLIVGMLVTAIMQSSSASMGILQTLALTGIVNWGSAVFIALGQNIGTCVVALISAIGADRNAKRAAMIHLEFNTIGSLIFGVAAYIVFLFVPGLAHSEVTSTSLALFHTSFNVLATLLLLPAANWLVKLSGILIPKQEIMDHTVRLDARLLNQPAIALAAADNEIVHMAQYALENISYSRDVLLNDENYEKLMENEDKVNKFNNEINLFLSKLKTTSMTSKQQLRLKNSILALRDIEHISDRCKEIANESRDVIHPVPFSEHIVEDVNSISAECYKAVKYAIEIYQRQDPELIKKVNRYEDTVDAMERKMKRKRLQKLEAHNTDVINSIKFLDAMDCYERIADHAERLAHYIAIEEGVEPGTTSMKDKETELSKRLDDSAEAEIAI
ncbi:Na/Pi cotransporter family protein [Ileibacterium valens]|uniref:Na/Pi cotransporter family protein n=1 Tax=Ileibacterium valens TaxID=1862668 RepID=UPI0023545C70|nr:Na/Pi cotransporter family protein [Ileibacterium valens]